MERRLAAILVADVAGCSAMVGRDEEGTIAAFKGCLEALAPIIGMHGGRVVKTMGDGLLVEYTSVVDAVVLAQAMQRRIAERNRHLPAGTSSPEVNWAWRGAPPDQTTP